MTSPVEYTVNAGFLEIKDSRDARLLWRGTFDEGSVAQALVLPETGECIVIVEGMRRNPDRNLMRIKPDGTITWRAEPAPGFGPYVRAAFEDGVLVAWSWSGYNLRIDPKSGAISGSSFVK
jgi:hypothetical protein